MATTHALVGIAIAAVASLLVPDIGLVTVAAAAAGGFFPDLDLYAGHRKTLHFPVYYGVMAATALAMAVFAPAPYLWAIALFLTAAAVHSMMDVFGGGLELRPWEGTSQQAVYSHFHGRWVAPRRWIRYDGAPEDLGLALLVAVPGMLAFGDPVTMGIAGLLGISGVYVVLRKPMVALAEWLFAKIPISVRVRLPERFVEDLS